ncbi:MAG TPA: uroporphyrinogen-III C-methyltransferase [Actinomycetota bacterium]|nr:uroporphyrinogen-III C-methyltransferase [Actinomycetota bacterium]
MRLRAEPGTVYLVGAGPGDPGLITAKGLALIRSCDVLVYDRLVAPELIDEAPPGAERIYVGKEPGTPQAEQSDINVLLVARALGGAAVVRLKGGDPFVFGRGGEEAGALAAHDVPFEVVPGVSAAIAVPAYAGIPVTHRDTAASFTVVTGARSGSKEVDWSSIARSSDTIVLMMGVRALRAATTALIAAGRDPLQPAAVIERGAGPDQRTIVSDLAGIADVAEAAGVEPPATAIVGDVVSLRADLSWWEERLPLEVRR